jgi:hypothetical protein
MTKKLEIDGATDAPGSIRIRLPGPPARYEVHVTVEWEERSQPTDARGWPVGWFEATAGSIGDPTFVRPQQPPLEPIEDLD